MTTFLIIIITLYIIVKVAFFSAVVWVYKHSKKHPNTDLIVNNFDVDILCGNKHITGSKISEHNCQLTVEKIGNNS